MCYSPELQGKLKCFFFQEESSGKDIDPGAAFDPDIDVQLDSLRKKLAKVITMLIASVFFVCIICMYF